ncbi:MAG: response regulator [Magnetococcales bacterium]|nr:response regulator [Magnetococcales bacterium]
MGIHCSDEKLKLMIIDDELEIIKSIERYLRFQPIFCNLSFMRAMSMSEAFGIIDDETPNIIFMDIHLQDYNGIKFIQRVKKKYPMTQIIVITGKYSLESAKEVLSVGAVDCIKKPLSMEIIAKITAEAIERYNRWEDIRCEKHPAFEGETCYTPIRLPQNGIL